MIRVAALVLLLASTTLFTSPSAMVAAPRLGGSIADFASLGPRTDKDRGADSMQYLLGGCRGGSAKWAIENIDGKVSSIMRYACGDEKISRSAAHQEARGFFPSDAVARRRFVAQDGSPAEMLFSPKLRSIFPRNLFRTVSNTLAEHGSFSFVWDAEGSMWALAIGANP